MRDEERDEESVQEGMRMRMKGGEARMSDAERDEESDQKE